MRRSNEIVGRTIVNGETGDRVGKASDVLINPGADQVVGLVVSGGVLASEKGVLPFVDVRSLGGDVIVAHGETPVLDSEQWQGRRVETIRCSTLTGKRLVTSTGQELGPLHAVCFEETSGRISGFEVTQSGLGGLVHHYRVIEPSGDVVVGPDVILLSDDEVARKRQREVKAPEVARSDTSRAPSLAREATSPAHTLPEPPIEPRR